MERDKTETRGFETGLELIGMTDELIRVAANITPSPRQVAWQRLEFTAFVHFGINTFTDREWGDGTEDPALFNPTRFDARQWVSVLKDAGINGLVLTAKHHDGFCLWPSRYTDHSVKSSPWRDGKGDVVREVAEACREAGIKLGVYLSPWDRHERTYGTDAYNDFFKAQLTELLTGYGPLYCVWFDGACGEGPNGRRQVYDWEGYYELIRKHQPDAVISVCGPDVRWCGNEAGRARKSEWSVVPVLLQDVEKIASESQKEEGYEFSQRVSSSDEDLGSRERIKKARKLVWYPAEVNTSIRPGWFYHAHEDDKVKSLEELLRIYYGAVGGNAVLLLNFPPDRRGLIHEADAARARELGRVLRETFATDFALGAQVTASESREPEELYGAACIVDGRDDTYWAPREGTESATVELALPCERTFNVVMLQEYIHVGQRVERFVVEIREGPAWRPWAESTTIGYKRLLRGAPATADRVRIRILESRLSPTLMRVGLFRSPV